MRQAGVQIYRDIKDLCVLGFFDTLKNISKFLGLRRLLLQKIRQESPDALVLIDFSGFNLRLAQSLRQKIPVIYYITPQVWASRQGRIKTLKKFITKCLVIFRFEEEFYKKYGIEAKFVGHPLLDIVKTAVPREISQNKPTIALLPGSRISEVKKILPVMLRACAIIKKSKDIQILIVKAQGLSDDIFKIPGASDARIIEGKTYDCLNMSDFALVASGSATIETAIMNVPFAIIYKMGTMSYLLYRPQVRVPFIGMVNIVAGKKIIEEFIQFNAHPQKIADYCLNVLNNPSQLEHIKSELARVKALLGSPGASQRAAEEILSLLSH